MLVRLLLGGGEPEHVSLTGDQLTVHQISRDSGEVHIQQQQRHTACRVAAEVMQNRLTYIKLLRVDVAILINSVMGRGIFLHHTWEFQRHILT